MFYARLDTGLTAVKFIQNYKIKYAIRRSNTLVRDRPTIARVYRRLVQRRVLPTRFEGLRSKLILTCRPCLSRPDFRNPFDAVRLPSPWKLWHVLTLPHAHSL